MKDSPGCSQTRRKQFFTKSQSGLSQQVLSLYIDTKPHHRIGTSPLFLQELKQLKALRLLPGLSTISKEKIKRYKEHSRAGWFYFTLCHLPLLLSLLVSPSWEAVIGKNPKETRASLVDQMVKNPPAMWETWVRTLGWEDPLQEGMATHCNTRALRIPWTEEPGRLQSLRSHRVGHN